MANPEVELEVLFKTQHKRLCNLAYKVVRDKDAAKDIVQDVFLKVWRNREKLERTDAIEGYLLRATSYTALNHLRDNKKLIRLGDEMELNHLSTSQDSNEIAYTEFEMKVQEAINRLPPKCKVIYLLSREEEMKYAQIAEALDLSIKTVENQMSIALHKIREDLRPFLIPSLILIPLILGLLAFILL
jgi:RNA polymerase sigma-70 factor (ECF subfamily)